MHLTSGGLGINLKADPETTGLLILILRQVASPSLAKVLQEVLLTGNLEDIAPMRFYSKREHYL